MFAEFVLKADRDVLAPGEAAELMLLGFIHLPYDMSNEAIEIALGRVEHLKDPQHIKNWRVTGKGNLTVEADQTQATY